MNEITTTKEPGRPMDLVSKAFDQMGQNFEELLPEHVTPKRFKQVVMTAISSSSDLMVVATTPEGRKSIIMSALKCASDGLVPDGREAALVKFNQKDGPPLAQYLPMCRGIVTRMQQSPKCKEIGVNLVYSKEEFHFSETSDGTEFRHTPILFGDKGDLVGAYAFMRTADGGFYFAPLDKAELEKIEKSSKAKFGPWTGPFKSEMQKKSALKRVAKIAPVSREVMDMLQYDNETFHEIEPIAEKPKMLDRLREAKEPKAVAPQDDPETPPTDEPDVMEGEIIDGEGLAQGYDLPVLEDRISAAQAVAYATAWAALYKASNKADRDALWAQTEDAVDRVGKISSKALDICNDALNSPAE